MRKVIDCVLYNGEDDIFDLRIQELSLVVDEFWVIEGNYTFTGIPKELSFEKQALCRKWPMQKIKYFPFLKDAESISSNPWVNEIAQRNYISCLVKNCGSDDLILFSDADEIPRPESVSLARIDAWSNSFGFEMTLHYLKFNFALAGPVALKSQVWAVAFSVELLNIFTADQMRMGIRDRSIPARILENAGWHFSYMMNETQISDKIKSFSHQEFNTPEFTKSISVQKTLDNREDLLLRDGYIWDYCPIDTLPKTIRYNLRKYRNQLV